MTDSALRALTDPTRAAILRRLLSAPDGRATVGALADALELTQPTVSHHMARLRDLGLVTGEPEGRRVWYSVAPNELDRVADVLDALEAGEHEVLADETSRQVKAGLSAPLEALYPQLAAR